MNWMDERGGQCDSASGAPRGWRMTRWEVLAVVAVLGVVLAILLPAIQISRENARRTTCVRNLKEIGLGVHNYMQANGPVFPPGTVCTSAPIQPGNQYDVWKEAAHTGAGTPQRPGPQGTGLLLRIFPYIEDTSNQDWRWTAGISNTSEIINPNNDLYNLKYAMLNEQLYYCPSRREGLRPQDHVMMLSPAWTGGGTDYGGCAGRYAAFSLKTGYNLCDASMRYSPDFRPAGIGEADDAPATRWGIFGRVNRSTVSAEIRDGESNTFLTGELQRITDMKFESKDGWVIGGPATLFTTGALYRREGKMSVSVASSKDGSPLNNDFFGSPGSGHPGGANFGMADGAVR